MIDLDTPTGILHLLDGITVHSTTDAQFRGARASPWAQTARIE